MVAVSPLIDPAPGLMIWTIVCFAITYYVLKKFAFGRIQGVIDERRERIRKSIQEADNARVEARKLLEEHRQLRAQAQVEAEEILAEGRRLAESMRERVREETDADRQRRLEETKREIQAETARALEQIRSEIAILALDAAEKVTRRSLDEDDQRRLIEDAIGELDFSVLERGPR